MVGFTSKKFSYSLAVLVALFCCVLAPEVNADDGCVVAWQRVKIENKTLACRVRSASERALGLLDRRGRFRKIGKRRIETTTVHRRPLRSFASVCRGIDPLSLPSRWMRSNSNCRAGFGPTPAPTQPAVPTPSPTASPTVTPTPEPQPRIYLSESSVDFGTVGIGEARYRSILIRPLIGTSQFEQIELLNTDGISLLSPSAASGRGAIPCQNTLDRFCVVVIRLDAASDGIKSATLSIRYSDVDNPSLTLTSSVPVIAHVQTAPTVDSSMFRTVSLRNIAAAQNLSVKDYLRAEYDRVSAAPYNAPNDADLFSAPPIWRNNWANSVFDFSGVAWDSHQAGTAISRCHITMATHYQRSGTITFHRKDGTAFVSSIVQRASLASDDITIGRISPCLPPDWTVYRILSSEADVPYGVSELTGAPYITTHFNVTDAIRRMSLMALSSFSTFARYTLPAYLPLNQCGANLMCAYPQSGDSGNPAFLLVDGELVLISQWWTTAGGPNFAHPTIQQAIRDAVLSMP